MDAEQETRVVKRRRTGVANGTGTGTSNKKSRIFAPYRTIGLVSSTAVPFVSLPLGKTTFQLTTSIGRSLQTYDVKRGLQLVFVTSPQTPEDITATIAWDKSTIAAWGGGKNCGVWVFRRGKRVGQLERPQDTMRSAILRFVIFGSWIVGCSRDTIEIWKSVDLEHYTTIRSTSAGSSTGFSGALCTLPTYLNKLFVGKDDGSVEIWNVSTAKLVYTMLPDSADFGSVTALSAAPALSIIAVAYNSAQLVLRNVKTDQTIIKFRTGDDPRAAVSCISFRTDGAGAGEDGRSSGSMATACLDSGDVTFWDLNAGGKKVGVLRGAHSPPSADGSVAGGISGMEFLSGQAVLATSGRDNALKTWIFDDMPFSPIPRILHSRGGHAATVSALQFLPTEADGTDSIGKWLMSSSHDRSFWSWSLRRDNQNTELSQGNIRRKAKKAGILNGSLDVSNRGTTLEELKAPRITSIACSMNRDGGIGALAGVSSIWTNETKSKSKSKDSSTSSTTGWESVVTAHEGDKYARTWFWGRKRAGRWKFKTGDSEPVTSVAISPCGTFALVGSAGGIIDVYNLQSGMHRQRYPVKLTAAQAKTAKTASLQTALAAVNSEVSDRSRKFRRGEGQHKGAVTGIIVDNLNQTAVSCGSDGKVKFWDFAKGLLRDEVDWSLTSCRRIRHHRSNDLLAVGCEDGFMRVVDIETHKLVRELWTGGEGSLDFTFSNDGRWILSIGADSIIRVHDLASGHLIEALRFKSQPTALSFSITGEYLATAHENSVGIHLWANRSLFAHVSTRKIGPQDVVDMDAPTVSGESGAGLIDAAFEDSEDSDVEIEQGPSSIEQLSKDLLTLSLVPKARWQTLLHLDTIRDRNKPKEAPKKPQAAPFFLSALVSSQGPDATVNGTAPSAPSTSRITKIADPTTASTSTFTTLLAQLATTPTAPIDPAPLCAHLAALPPSAADVAIRTLDPAPPYTEPTAFVRALTARLRQRRDYELVQTWMAVFLRCHATLVLESDAVRAALGEWREESGREAARLGDLVGYVKGVVGWVGGVV